MEEVKNEAVEPKKLNFLEEIIESDLKSGKVDSVLTRFPPEPNGYLHLGHAKSICINFGLAQKYGGKTNLRFDDTNPTKEDTEYVDSIKEDIQWLGFQWDKEKYASDYFDQLYESGYMSKQDAYQWLADLIMAPLSEAHIGHLGEYYCKQVIEESRKLLERRKAKTRGRYYAQKGGALAS